MRSLHNRSLTVRKVLRLLEISLINTIRMNWFYFGWKGVLGGYIIAAKNLKILRLDRWLFEFYYLSLSGNPSDRFFQ